MMTIGFVLLAELVIFIPSAATFRQNWLEQRALQGGILTQALLHSGNFDGELSLSEYFMTETDVVMMSVRQKGEDSKKLILGAPPNSNQWEVVDLSQGGGLPKFRDAFKSFFGSGEGYMRVLAVSPTDNLEELELILPRAKLKWAMWDYFERILLLSIVIALITGALIYLAMLFLIIRPIEKLAQNVTAFRDNPQSAMPLLKPSARKDEIGQLERVFFDMKNRVRSSFKQRERLATLGMAVAKINHDLRNVLTSAQLISDRLTMNKDERVAKMGQRLTRAIDRGVNLTAEVLNFSQAKDDPVELQSTRISMLIGEAAADTLESFGTGLRKIKFKNKVPSELAVIIDPDHTYRIFHNLFRNAAQAMSVLKDDNAKRLLSVSAEIEGGKVHIFVRDTGGGLPKKARENLFKAFTSSSGQSGSTGLGLTISKELANAQGGDLKLHETDEAGSVFAVTFDQA